MGDHTGKQFVYPTQKQGRDAHPERKCIGILSNEGGREVNQALGRDTHPERSTSILSDEEHSISETRQTHLWAS